MNQHEVMYALLAALGKTDWFAVTAESSPDQIILTIRQRKYPE